MPRIPVVFGAIGACAPLRFALAQSTLLRTPDEILGPFYPVGKTPDPGAGLTQLPGKPGQATCQLLNVMGRVLNIRGEPERDAKLEIWQANAYGRY
ncbi:dioxygenase family protein [Trinickia mobilis]|uniref:dioxygenase family protein n=1 Tax=Trinickia mobilis TaxID=2816356 RepID=UPI001A8BFC09|nr:hypothetical protein [Trinickia mobilis]